jgi:hypothetical protein
LGTFCEKVLCCTVHILIGKGCTDATKELGEHVDEEFAHEDLTRHVRCDRDRRVECTTRDRGCDVDKEGKDCTDDEGLATRDEDRRDEEESGEELGQENNGVDHFYLHAPFRFAGMAPLTSQPLATPCLYRLFRWRRRLR